MPDLKKPRVGVCSSAVPTNVEGFIVEFRARFEGIIESAEFIKLPYSRLDEDFDLEATVDEQRIDVLILCHSINNRRLSLTDVTDALYDKFIPRASRKVGKELISLNMFDFVGTSIGKCSLTKTIIRLRK